MAVYAKDRKKTATQYIVTAQALQTAVIKYLMNEKHISKKWRYMLVQDAVNKVCELLDNVVASNSVYPNTEEKLQLRKKYLQTAAINAYQIENKFQCMVRVIETVKIKDLENVMSLLFDEINLLKGAYQNAKLVK